MLPTDRRFPVVSTPPPELLVTVIPADVGYQLLVRAGLAQWRLRHRGENWRVDQVLIELSNAALRWHELAANGQNRAPTGDNGARSARVTTTQAADMTGLSPRTIRRAIADGRLPAERVGRTWLIDRRDVGRYRTRGT